MNIGILNRPLRHAAVPFDEPSPGDAKGVTGIGARVKERMWQRMARECEAMVQHAFSTGRVVPIEVMVRLDQAVSAADGLSVVAAPDRHDDASIAAARGASTMEMSRFVSLAVAHAGLARAIAPATPEAVLLMADERERHPLWSAFGPLPLVRQMLGLALLSLVVLLAVSIDAVVNTENMAKSLLQLSGFPLLMVETFLVSAASLGACFANLQRINTFISEGTYDPRFQSTYWTRWVMGVISGVILSQLVYNSFLAHSGADTGARAAGAIAQPILALVGGYSVDFVHGVLRRAINTVGNFFSVSTDAAADNQQRPAIAEALAQERLATTSELAALQRALSENPDPEEMRKRLDGLIQRMAVKAG
jgi:hypothetical protein